MTKISPRQICLFLLLWLVIHFLSLPGAAADSAAEEMPLYLKSLKILGNSIIPDKTIKKQLTVELPSIWPWKSLPPFKASELDFDVEQLKAFYRTQGFYHTEITTQVQQNSWRQVEVAIIIAEGPWITTKAIQIKEEGSTDSLNLTPLVSQWPLTVGARFNDSDYESLKSLYLNYLFDHGYPRGDVQGKVYLDDKLNTAKVVLTIDPGPISFFGKTKIAGRPETPDYIILRKMAFKEGELFDLRKIYQSQKNLYKLDLFSSVAVTPQEVPPTESHIPIDVKVTEAKKRSVTGGLGWGTEDQFRARLGLRIRNLFGGGRYLDFDGRYSRIESRFAGTLTNPQLWGSHVDLIISSGLFYRQYPSFNDRTLSLQSRLERELPWDFRVYGGYSLQYDSPFSIPGTVQELFVEPQDQTFRSSLGFVGFRRDTADDLLDPTRGGLLLAHGELAPTFLGSSYQFASLRLEGRRYFDLWEKEIILATRAVVGLMSPIQSTSEIPLFRRFFTGGYNTVRGYRLFILGPTDIAGNPVGGNSLLEANAELRFPIYQDFRGVAFVDAGNVYPKIANLDPGNLYYGAGCGVRYRTPVGPVGIDIAFPLRGIQQKQDGFQVYFSIGQTF
jgi:outer membrane protein assembly complex protein YaeT